MNVKKVSDGAETVPGKTYDDPHHDPGAGRLDTGGDRGRGKPCPGNRGRPSGQDIPGICLRRSVGGRAGLPGGHEPGQDEPCPGSIGNGNRHQRRAARRHPGRSGAAAGLQLRPLDLRPKPLPGHAGQQLPGTQFPGRNHPVSENDRCRLHVRHCHGKHCLGRSHGSHG